MAYETHAENQVPQDAGQVRCAVYARSAITPNPESIKAQIKACRDAALSRGWGVLDDYIELDGGKSGERKQHPKLRRALLWRLPVLRRQPT